MEKYSVTLTIPKDALVSNILDQLEMHGIESAIGKILNRDNKLVLIVEYKINMEEVRKQTFLKESINW